MIGPVVWPCSVHACDLGCVSVFTGLWGAPMRHGHPMRMGHMKRGVTAASPFCQASRGSGGDEVERIFPSCVHEYCTSSDGMENDWRSMWHRVAGMSPVSSLLQQRVLSTIAPMVVLISTKV